MENGGFWWISVLFVYNYIYIYNHPKSIFYVSKDDFMYICIYLYLWFLWILPAPFVVVSAFFSEGDWIEIMSSHTLKSTPAGVIGMILWASGIHHTWDDSTQLPFLSLRKLYFGSTVKRAPFYCNEASPNQGFLKLGIAIQSERHAFGNRFNHPGFLESGYSSTKK